MIVVERHESPLVSAQLLIKNGGEVDPNELAGLADMTANLLTKGTQTRDATKIAQEVESLGASLDSGARWDSSFATVSGMSSKMQQAMEILADVVRAATAAQAPRADDIVRAKEGIAWMNRWKKVHPQFNTVEDGQY